MMNCVLTYIMMNMKGQIFKQLPIPHDMPYFFSKFYQFNSFNKVCDQHWQRKITQCKYIVVYFSELVTYNCIFLNLQRWL
jgi:hypothetical protein